jgi:alanine-synthesizing transaminase
MLSLSEQRTNQNCFLVNIIKSMFARRTDWDLATNRITQTLERLRVQGKPLIDLTVSNPTEAGLEYSEPQIRTVLSAAEVMQYSPVAQGMRSARQAVSQYYAERANASHVNPNHIFLTTSTSEAYTWAFRLLCGPGDHVLTAQPSYPLFSFLADICDVRLSHYPLFYDHGWQIDIHALEQAITPETRAILLVHPNNPTGSCVKASEKEVLNRICRERGIALIVDEVFSDYPLNNTSIYSFADNDAALTFTLSGVSKICGLPQMKVGWMVVSGPVDLQRTACERLDVIADTYLSLATPQQIALPNWLQQRQKFQSSLQQRLQTNLAELDRQLTLTKSIRRLDVEAGWYATLRLPAIKSDEDLTIHLMEEHGVIVQPGHYFDFAAEGFIVVSLMTPQKQFSDGLQNILA